MYKLAYTERFKKAFNDLTNNEQIQFQNKMKGGCNMITKITQESKNRTEETHENTARQIDYWC